MHRGRAPWGAPATDAHVPTLPGTSQAWHWPPQAWSQQTPSVQWAEAHWLEPAQLAPAARSEVHTPAEQKLPVAQSVSTEQLPRQAVAPQR